MNGNINNMSNNINTNNNVGNSFNNIPHQADVSQNVSGNSKNKKILTIIAIILSLIILCLILYYFLVIRVENLRKPVITLDVPSTINDTDNYKFPTTTDLEPSKGTVVCTDTTTGQPVSSSLDLLVGTRNVTCTATKKNGVSNTVTKQIIVNGYYDAKTPTYKLSATDGAQVNESAIKIPENTDGIQYGPYKPYKAGVYLVTINGKNLESIKEIKVYSADSKIDYNIVSVTSNVLVYKINVVSDVPSLEVVAVGSLKGEVSIEKVSITPSENFEYSIDNDVKIILNDNESNGIIQLKSSSDYTYGPYKTLETGYYHVIIAGSNVDKISKVEIVNFEANVRQQMGLLENGESKTTYCIDLTGDYLDGKAEIYIYGKDNEIITIDNYIINKK